MSRPCPPRSHRFRYWLWTKIHWRRVNRFKAVIDAELEPVLQKIREDMDRQVWGE